jgi:hypothetical protein
LHNGKIQGSKARPCCVPYSRCRVPKSKRTNLMNETRRGLLPLLLRWPRRRLLRPPGARLLLLLLQLLLFLQRRQPRRRLLRPKQARLL